MSTSVSSMFKGICANWEAFREERTKQHKKADSENQSPLGIRDDLLEKEKYVTRKGKEKTF